MASCNHDYCDNDVLAITEGTEPQAAGAEGLGLYRLNSKVTICSGVIRNSQTAWTSQREGCMMF